MKRKHGTFLTIIAISSILLMLLSACDNMRYDPDRKLKEQQLRDAEASIYSPPKVSVIKGDETIAMKRTGYTWSRYLAGGGYQDVMTAVEDPRLTAEGMKALQVTADQAMSLYFEVKPLKYTIKILREDGSSTLLSEKETSFNLDTMDGPAIYVVNASWPQGEATYILPVENQLHSPPKVTIINGDTEVNMTRGGYSWTVDLGNGNSQTTETGWIGYREHAKDLTPFMIVEDTQLEIEFEEEPDNYSLNVLLKENESISIKPKDNKFHYDPRPDETIYALHAHWPQGDAHYTLVVKSERPLWTAQSEFIRSESAEGFLIDLEKINEKVWIHRSYMTFGETEVPANGLMVLTDAGVVLIDTPWNDEQTEALVEMIRTSFDQEIVQCIVTHAHDDTMGGIASLQANGIEVISTQMTHDIGLEKGYSETTVGLSDETTLNIGGIGFETYYPGGGHTIDNIVVNIEDYDILFGGCLIKGEGAKNIGNTAEADIDNWASSVMNVKELYTDTEIVIPGHGQHGDLSLLDNTVRIIEDHITQ